MDRQPRMARALLLALAACGGPGEEPAPGKDAFSPPLTALVSAPPVTPAAHAWLAPVARKLSRKLGRLGPKVPGVPRVLFLGDSFTCGFGLSRDQPAWPEIVGRELAEEGVAIEIVNAGLTGDTSYGGRARLATLADLRPDLLVVELGGNDYLGGLSLAGVDENLREIVAQGRAMGARVVLSGLSLPAPLLRTQRGQDFVALYPALAADLGVDLVPDLLEDVVDAPRFVQADGLHPSAEGHAVMAHNALPTLRAVLAELSP